MTAKKFDISKIRVASPCPAAWENMKGDQRTRFCRQCSLNVYNISEMTEDEVQALVANSGGRICARIYKRADGTLLTRDCPVGIRAYRKRISHFAGAIFTAVIGLCSLAFGQSDSQKHKKELMAKDIKITKTTSQTKLSSLKATVTDANGAIIPGAEIILQAKDKKINFKTKTSAEGTFEISSIPAGAFSLEIKAMGFGTQEIEEIRVNKNEIIQFDLSLEVINEAKIGILDLDEPVISTTDTNITTTIHQKVINKLPF